MPPRARAERQRPRPLAAAGVQDSLATDARGSWLARVAAEMRPMPFRIVPAPLVLPRYVLDLRGPEPVAPRFAPLPAPPGQERRRRRDDER